MPLSLKTPVELLADVFIPRVYTTQDGQTLPYRLLIPTNADPRRKLPVVVFFHGSGERGVDNLSQLVNGIEAFAGPESQANHPCFVIAPQCPREESWVNVDWKATREVRFGEPTPALALALAILDEVATEFSVDLDRVYLAGLSMGGYAVWDCLTRFPERFAAGIAVCGGGDESKVTPEMARVPVWVFHSTDDDAVPVERSREMVQSLTEVDGRPRYTEYNFAGHASWVPAFETPDLHPWIFRQRRAEPSGSAALAAP